jgi:hypothetical protein
VDLVVAESLGGEARQAQEETDGDAEGDCNGETHPPPRGAPAQIHGRLRHARPSIIAKDWRKPASPLISCDPVRERSRPGNRTAALPARRAARIVALLFAFTSAKSPGQEKTPDKPAEASGLKEVKVDVHSFKVVESYSGPVSYYKLVEDPDGSFIRAVYRPPLETVTLAAEVPESLRQSTKRVRWKWRAQVFPKKGNECSPGYGDSAAVVYVSWKRGLKWYSIKYVWSTEAKKGDVCDQKRNLFVVQDTVVLQSGGPSNVWKEESIDPSAEFRAHFEGDVPDFVGIGIMSDGDQTRSISAADYAGFALLH